MQKEEQISKIAWRVVGTTESPIRKPPDLTKLIDGLARKYVPGSERKRVIETINGWYETRDGRPSLAEGNKGKVHEWVLRGAAQRLLEAKPEQKDTLFWAMGAVDTEEAVETIRASWRPEQIDKFVEYAISALKVLCEKSDVLDPSRAAGFKADRGKVYADPKYKEERIKTVYISERYQPSAIYWGLYAGVAKVILLTMMLRPDQFPQLVESADHPTVQGWALFIQCQYHRTDPSQALDWLKGKPSEPLTAIAIVHTLKNVQELAWEAQHQGRNQREGEELHGTASQLLSCLVNQLAQFEPAQSVRWLSELYENRVLILGMNRRTSEYDPGEYLEEHCVDEMTELVRRNWDSGLRAALKSEAPWGAITQQNLPLGTIAQKIHIDYPDRSAEIARIVIEKHRQRMGEIVENNEGIHYTLTDSRAVKWMRGLGAALAIALPESESPMDWAITQCSRLPLTAWDADEAPRKFRVADEVAQTQLAVAFYAVLASYETGVIVEPETVRRLAERAWQHCHFVGQQQAYRLEEPELEELAARVAVALGKPGEEWLVTQAKNSKIGPRGLWGMVDAYIENHGHPILANELSRTITARYRNSKVGEISTFRYLAMIWQRLESADAALETAEAMMEYHRRTMEREDYLTVMGLLILAARQKGSTSKTKRDMRTLYDHLWTSHTPREEIETKEIAGILLAQKIEG